MKKKDLEAFKEHYPSFSVKNDHPMLEALNQQRKHIWLDACAYKNKELKELERKYTERCEDLSRILDNNELRN